MSEPSTLKQALDRLAEVEAENRGLRARAERAEADVEKRREVFVERGFELVEMKMDLADARARAERAEADRDGAREGFDALREMNDDLRAKLEAIAALPRFNLEIMPDGSSCADFRDDGSWVAAESVHYILATTETETADD